MKVTKKRVLKTVWICVNIICLILGFYWRSIHPDGVIVFLFLMSLVTFPIGFIVYFLSPLFVIFIAPFSYESYPYLHDVIFPWVLFVVGGYIQWFILVPKIYSYIKQKKR